MQRRHYVGRTVEPPRGFTGRLGGTGGCQQKSESMAVEGLEMVSDGFGGGDSKWGLCKNWICFLMCLKNSLWN